MAPSDSAALRGRSSGSHPSHQSVRRSASIETEDRFQFQPQAVSPIWDTSYAAFTLGEMGSGADLGCYAKRSADWMLDRECRREGRLVGEGRPGLEPSGWAFEFANEHSSGYRRYRHGAAGAGCMPRRRIRSASSAWRDGRSTGCWECNRATAAGPPSMWIAIGSCWRMSRLPITTRC